MSKRQFVNTKIIEQRYLSLPSLEKNESIGGFYLIANESAFLPEPLVSRNLFPFYNAGSPKEISLSSPPDNISTYFKIQTSGYYFFDYEKALNYKSEISKFINPYNIQQIFGKGSLANYFNFTSCVLEKNISLSDSGVVDSSRTKTYSLAYEHPEEDNFAPKFRLVQDDKDPDVNFHRMVGSQGKLGRSYGRAGAYSKINFSPADNETLYSTLIQRGFDTNNGIGDYRLSLFELNDYQASGPPGDYFSDFELRDINLQCTITIRDTTMLFYDLFIRQKIFSLLEGITRYLDFAEDFCSYNNIDDRFNDFFIESIRNEFFEPYPWSEATFYYYAFLQMMLASQTEEQTRRREGVLLDLDSIREAAEDRRKMISPETGYLSELQRFHLDLKKLVEQYFTKDSGLDRNNEIYRIGTTDEAYVVINFSKIVKFSRSDIFDKENISSELNVEQLEELQTESELSKCVALFLEIRSTDDPEVFEPLVLEYVERGCDSFSNLSAVGSCRNFKERWVALKAEYDRYRQQADDLEKSFGFSLNSSERRTLDAARSLQDEKKEEMEAALASYLDEGCDDLIGPINDGDTLEQDMQDAGLLE